jgi:hypothetical protein
MRIDDSMLLFAACGWSFPSQSCARACSGTRCAQQGGKLKRLAELTGFALLVRLTGLCAIDRNESRFDAVRISVWLRASRALKSV